MTNYQKAIKAKKECEATEQCTVNYTKNIIVKYETIDIVEQRDILETTRNLARLLTEEEFNEIMIVYKKVIDRLCDETEF